MAPAILENQPPEPVEQLLSLDRIERKLAVGFKEPDLLRMRVSKTTTSGRR
jgi:hypothetical protein